MKRKNYYTLLYFFVTQIIICSVTAQPDTANNNSDEAYRPQIHFSSAAHWMNDPNGMVFHQGIYHLFFQYYPEASVWGPMHWGHATSKDMIHWKHQPIALYPDSLGYIFSGSAVADVSNSSGFGKDGKIPLVAIFTHHDPTGEKEGKSTYQKPNIAFSLDDGKTWTKSGKTNFYKDLEPGTLRHAWQMEENAYLTGI